MEEVARLSKNFFEFVECSNGQRSNDPRTRKFVRTHVMHNYRRRQQAATKEKLGNENNELRVSRGDVEIIIALQNSHILSSERWSRDPFDSFPVKMQPYMHELLHLCKSSTSLGH